MEKNELTTYMMKLMKKLCIGLEITDLFTVACIFAPVLPLKIIGAILSVYRFKIWYDSWKIIKSWDDVPPKTFGEKFDEILYDSVEDDAV